jgi:hypothetical protein
MGGVVVVSREREMAAPTDRLFERGEAVLHVEGREIEGPERPHP